MTQTDKFSATRCAAVWRFYSPGMTRHLILIGVATLICYLCELASTFGFDTFGMGIFTATNFALMLVYYSGPLHFARFRDRTLTLQLPATAGERTAVIMGYVLVAVPAVIAAVWFCASGTASFFTDHYNPTRCMMEYVSTMSNEAGLSLPGTTKFSVLQHFQDVIPTMVCLCCVMSSRRNAIVNGVAGIVVALIAMSFIGGIYGVFTAMTAGLSDAMSGAEFNPDKFLASFTSTLVYIIYSISVLAVATVMYTAIRIYRSFRHQQA